MGLFSPWFLAGLAALGLPLWLHLLRQFKRTPQPFSSLMFFERQIQSSSKHRKLRYLTLLALRMLLLALLAVLFADPFVLRTSSAEKTKNLTVIAVDRSFSMRYKNRIGDAQAQATGFVNRLAGSSRLQVMALDSKAGTLTQPQADKAAANDAIAGIQATDELSSYGELSRVLRVMEQTTHQNLDVHFFTDAQQTSMPAAFTDLQVGPNTSLTIHEIGQGKSSNWAVESVRVPSRVYGDGELRLVTGVAGWQTPPASKRVSVLLDGKVIAHKDMSLPGSGRCDLEFDHLTIPYGSHRGEVRIEPPDDLPDDDHFFFSVERADPKGVLFLYRSRPADSLFYKAAMDASPATGLKVKVESLSQVSQLNPGNFALLVLNDPGSLDHQIVGELHEYVSRGGALLIAVGPATTQSSAVPLTGEHLAETAITQAAASKTAELFVPGIFDNVQFVDTVHLTPKPEDRVLARFADGSPLLLEQPLGEGKVLIFASTLDNAGSDFPLHSSFVPFVVTTGTYLAGAGEQPSSVLVDSSIALRQSRTQNAAADVLGPDGNHEIPLSDATKVMSFNPGRVGFYDLHPASGKRNLLAVNADRRESNLTKVSAETLFLWRNTGTSSAGELAAETEAKKPFSLWRYLLVLVLLAAVSESIFAARYLSEEKQKV